MKLFNFNAGKLENLKVITIDNRNVYVDKVDEAVLNNAGYYKVSFQPQPDRRYYTATQTSELIGNVYTVTYTPVDRDVEEVKNKMLNDLEKAEVAYEQRDITLSNGKVISKEYAKHLKRLDKLNKTELRDKEGKKVTVTSQELKTILEEVEAEEELVYSKKWEKFDEISAFTTVAECILYEATEYQKEVDVIDEVTFEPTGATEIKTFHRNKVKEWEI